MKEELKIEYSVDEKDFINFRYTSLFPENFKVIGYIVLGIVLFSLLTNNWLWKLTSGQPVSITDFISVLLVTAVIFFMYYRLKRQYQSTSVFQNLINLELSNEAVRFEGVGYSSKIQWSNIYKVTEKKHYFVIFSQKQIGNIVSKSKLSTQEIADMKRIFSGVEGLNFTPFKQ